jgi:hypothetical protein
MVWKWEVRLQYCDGGVVVVGVVGRLGVSVVDITG